MPEAIAVRQFAAPVFAIGYLCPKRTGHRYMTLMVSLFYGGGDRLELS